ncbi:hypothetical protein [Spirillospora sp. NBC_01491]|uniref:hypothetical protein n=1 Tax=Spirillospora sp. NBC_01491 TaxID=2976007 RepID=UPI002E3330D6|nr:hypothetical protein [Spirillospora sp. NBC_01491]
MNNPPSSPDNSNDHHHAPRPDEAVRRLLPLTVWLCSDTTPTPNSGDTASTAAVRRSHSQMPKGEICQRHRQAVGRQLARHLISACTREGDVVAEGFTSSEATLAAAAELGRRGVALVPHFPLAQHIGARLRAALPKDQLNRVEMRPCRPDQMTRGLADHLGDVALVVAAPPPYETGGRTPAGEGRSGCPVCRTDPPMLTSREFGLFLAAAWRVLRPGGVLAITTTARHQAGRFIDPAPRIIRQVRGAGFSYVQHVVALRVPIQGDALVVQAGPTDMAQLRDTRSRALPPAVSVHADVSLFTKTSTPHGASR